MKQHLPQSPASVLEVCSKLDEGVGGKEEKRSLPAELAPLVAPQLLRVGVPEEGLASPGVSEDVGGVEEEEDHRVHLRRKREQGRLAVAALPIPAVFEAHASH